MPIKEGSELDADNQLDTAEEAALAEEKALLFKKDKDEAAISELISPFTKA